MTVPTPRSTVAPLPAVTPRLRLRIAAVAAAFLLNGFSFGQWAARIPDIQAQTHLDKPGLGFALLMAGIGAVLVMPLGGWLGSRFGTHRMTSLTLLGCAVMMPVIGLANGYVWLAASLALFGAAQGPMDVCMNANALAIERSPGAPVIISKLHGCWSIGSFAGAIVTAGAISIGMSVIVQFTLLAILLGCGAAFLWLAMLPDRHAQSGGFRLPPRRLAALGVLAYCGLVAEGSASDWSTLYARDSAGASEAIAPIVFATFSAAMATTRLLGDRLTIRFGPAALISAGGALSTVGLGLALAIPSPITSIVGFGMMGVGLASVVPVMFRAGGSQPGIPAAVGIAAVSTMGYAGGLSGPPVIGAAAGTFGLRGALVIVLSMVLVLAIAGPRALRGSAPVGENGEPAVPEMVP